MSALDLAAVGEEQRDVRDQREGEVLCAPAPAGGHQVERPEGRSRVASPASTASVPVAVASHVSSPARASPALRIRSRVARSSSSALDVTSEGGRIG